jgi:hypothetical protein
MYKFAHYGVPSDKQRENETYLEDAKLYVTEPENDLYAIEWLRFLPDSPMPDILKDTPHLAFAVDDIEAALEGKEILIEPFHPMEGVTVAFVMHEGIPVELMNSE